MKKLQLIIPAAGRATRFQQAIKPLIQVEGKALITWTVDSFATLGSELPVTYVIQQAHDQNNQLSTVLKTHSPASTIVKLNAYTDSPVETTLLGMAHLSPEDSVIVCDCDLYFESPAFISFLSGGRMGADSSVLYFKSEQPQFSYVSLSADRVTEIVEKKVISTNAVCGCYYFKSVAYLQGLIETTLENQKGSAEVFMSDVVQTAVKNGHTVMAFPCVRHISFGTPEEISRFKNAPR